jgi:hypothetical protein
MGHSLPLAELGLRRGRDVDALNSIVSLMDLIDQGRVIYKRL